MRIAGANGPGIGRESGAVDESGDEAVSDVKRSRGRL